MQKINIYINIINIKEYIHLYIYTHTYRHTLTHILKIQKIY